MKESIDGIILSNIIPQETYNTVFDKVTLSLVNEIIVSSFQNQKAIERQKYQDITNDELAGKIFKFSNLNIS